MRGRAITRFGWLPVVVGVALAVSCSGRFGDGLGQNDEPLSDVFVWAGLLLASIAYSVLSLLVWTVVRRLSGRQARFVLWAVLGLAVLAFVVSYPRFGEPTDSSGFGDADDALNILADSITEGFDAYDRETYLDQSLSPMMGAGVLAVPFRVVFGSAAYQNPFWLLVAAAVLARRYGSRVALGIAVPVLSGLAFAEHYLSGGDYLISGVILALAAYLFLGAVRGGGASAYGAAVVLGVASANRPTTLPVLAAVVVVLFAGRRLAEAAGPVALALVVNLSLWVPWWIARPGDYPPLERVGLQIPAVTQVFSLLLLLGALGFLAAGRWRPAEQALEPAERLSQQGPLLAVSGLPLLFGSVRELGRIVTYLWLAVPELAERLADLLAPDGPAPSDEG